MERNSWRLMDNVAHGVHYWRKNKASWHLTMECLSDPVDGYFVKVYYNLFGGRTPSMTNAQIRMVRGATNGGELTEGGELLRSVMPMPI